MIQELPPIIQQVGFDFPFDFENDPKKIWLEFGTKLLLD